MARIPRKGGWQPTAYTPPAAQPRPAYPTGTKKASPGGYGGMQQVPAMHQQLAITPRVRAEVDDDAVAAATMLPTKE